MRSQGQSIIIIIVASNKLVLFSPVQINYRYCHFYGAVKEAVDRLLADPLYIYVFNLSALPNRTHSQ